MPDIICNIRAICDKITEAGKKVLQIMARTKGEAQ